MAIMDTIFPILVAIMVTAVVLWGAMKLHKHNMLGYAVTVILAIVVLWVVGGKAETHSVKTEVVSVENGIVMVRLNNNTFSFYGDGFVKGDKIVIKIDDCDTSSIYDDRIITVERRMRRVHRHLPF